MSDVTTVICDNGSELLKCGFAAEAFPAAVVPCALAHPTGSSPEQAAHIGHEALQQASSDPTYTLTWPIAYGTIQHRPAMAAIWRHAFTHHLGLPDLQQAPARILLTEPLFSSAATRTALLDTMFETFAFQAASIQIQPVVTLLARGSMTGLAVDVGAGMAQVVPVLQGLPYLQHARKTHMAGREVAASLLELLQRRGHALSPADLPALAAAARQLCYVSCNYSQDLKLARETTALARTYTLPDGRTLRLGAERFKAPEVLFRPHLANKEQPGLSDMAFQCIQDMTIDTRRTLYENVVLSGGCTMLPGLPTRLEADLRRLYLEHTLKGDRAGLQRLKLRVHDAADRKLQVFRGAALLAQIMEDRPSFWITRQEWAEDPTRALTKCGVLEPASQR